MSGIETKVRNGGFGWEAIDIFLFSNGQKCTPPRKYHLRTDELDWWEAALNYLAKSHYGTSHTAVELYTLSGNKIQGPRELCDGMPCVAVVPPDTFTDAGYEKYLMRAARSLEKRKAKNANLTDQTKVNISEMSSVPCCPCLKKDTIAPLEVLPLEVTDKTGLGVSFTTMDPLLYASSPSNECSYIELQTNDEKPQLVEATENTINTIEENIAASIVHDNAVKPPKKIMQKSDASDPQLPRRILAASSILRNEKRSSNTARASFTRTTIQPTKNSKQDFQVKALKKSPKTNEAASLLTDTSKGVLKHLNENEMSEKLPLELPPSEMPTIEPSVPATLLKCSAMLSLNSKGFVTDPLPLQDLITDKNVVAIAEDTNLYQNSVPEVKSVKLDAYYPPVVDENTYYSISQTRVDEGIQTRVEISSCEVNTVPLKHSSPVNSKIKLIPATIVSQSNIMDCDIPLGNNCIAVINKGDAVNLKLQIQLKNGENHGNDQTNSEWKNVRKTSSLSNLFKRRRSDQNGEQSFAPTKSLDSVICGINECYTNVVVVQCSCCGNKTTVPRVETMPVYKDPNGFFILMPSTAQKDNYSCFCCRNHKIPCSDHKAMPALCVEELCKPKSSTVYPVVHEVGMVMTLTGSFGSQTDDRQWHRALGNTMISINKDQSTVDECGTLSNRNIEKYENVVSTANMPKVLQYERVDSYTQTEWCSILLVAHRHEDGKYSFHFPSLQMLKYYSLI